MVKVESETPFAGNLLFQETYFPGKRTVTIPKPGPRTSDGSRQKERSPAQRGSDPADPANSTPVASDPQDDFELTDDLLDEDEAGLVSQDDDCNDDIELTDDLLDDDDDESGGELSGDDDSADLPSVEPVEKASIEPSYDDDENEQASGLALGDDELVPLYEDGSEPLDDIEPLEDEEDVQGAPAEGPGQLAARATRTDPSIDLEMLGEDEVDEDDEEDSVELEGALLDGLELESSPDPDADPDDDAEDIELEGDEDLDPFGAPASSEPAVPLVNPFVVHTPPPPPVEPDEEGALDLDLAEEEEEDELMLDPAAVELDSDDEIGYLAIAEEDMDDWRSDPDGVSLDPADADEELEWLRVEARRLANARRFDEELSVLDRLLRISPDEDGITDRYEEVLAQVIEIYFPGKTPASIPTLTVEAWELPDLVRDPVLGAILGRMDGQTPLRDLYTALPDQEPGTVYRLVSRAKGKGLIRLDEP